MSTASIRRDLERTGLPRRTHGGAMSARLAAIEPSLADNEDRYRAEKTAIGRRAVTFVQRATRSFSTPVPPRGRSLASSATTMD